LVEKHFYLETFRFEKKCALIAMAADLAGSGSQCSDVPPNAVHMNVSKPYPYQNRIKTPCPTTTGVANRAKSRFPKLLKILKVERNQKKLWSGSLCAQGRCVWLGKK
jgi:hypothetical protein